MANHYAFEGRVALVTGGASGIGAATADRLREGGADVHVFDLAHGDDVRDSKAIQAAVDALPRLDVLVCAAGVGGDSLHTEDVTDEEWHRVHAINLDGVFFANRAALPKMKANGYGRIVNVASISGTIGLPGQTAYCSTKGAIVQLTRQLAIEHAPRVRVNAVAPGAIDTGFMDELLAGVPDREATLQAVAASHPLGRLARAEEVAEVIAFLASPRSSIVTGAVLMADGGFTAQ